MHLNLSNTYMYMYTCMQIANMIIKFTHCKPYSLYGNCLLEGDGFPQLPCKLLVKMKSNDDFFGTYPDTLLVNELIFPSGFEILMVPRGEDFSLQNEQINKQDMTLY